MIINTHAHLYPDKIAKAVEEVIFKKFGPLYSSFKVASLLEDMEKYDVAVAVGFCIAERPKVVAPSNDFMIRLGENKKIVGLGTIHPDSEGYREEIRRLRENGVKGIKASSIFQDFYPDEERMLRIYQEMGGDLIVYLHAGEQPGREAQTTPERLARVLTIFPKLKMVAAHFGGMHMLEEAKKHLVGKEIYFDTVWPHPASLDGKEITRLIQEHGSHKILFGTDFPIYSTKEQLEWFLSLPLSPEDRDLILYKNAQRLFGI